MSPSLVIQYELVKDSIEDFRRLAALEHEEIKEERPLEADWKTMRIINEQGNFRILVARVNGEMVGYLSFFIDFDIESYGTLIVNQAAWFVKKGYPMVGLRMYDKAMEEFKKMGVKFVYLHHTIHGRGSKLGRFFEKKGARLLGYNYIVNMKDVS